MKLFVLLLSLIMTSCLKAPYTQIYVEKHMVTKEIYWQNFQHNDAFKIQKINSDLLDYLKAFNYVDNYTQVPKIPSDEKYTFLKKELENALSVLPDFIKKQLKKRLFGIYIVENFGGYGGTFRIKGNDGLPIGSFFIVDSSIFSITSLKDWLEKQERSIFDKGVYSLTINIESNLPKYTYYLLHELSHTLAINENFFPNWTNQFNGKKEKFKNFPFYNLSWKKKFPNYWDTNSIFLKNELPEEKRIRYFYGARLKNHEILTVYQNLLKTNFPTPYSATNPADDFSDSFANYIFTQYLVKDYSVSIFKNSVEVLNKKPCWNTLRCLEKQRIIESYIKRLISQ